MTAKTCCSGVSGATIQAIAPRRQDAIVNAAIISEVIIFFLLTPSS